MADSAILFRVEMLRFSPPIEGHPAEWGDGSGMFMDKRTVTVTVTLTAIFTIITHIPAFLPPIPRPRTLRSRPNLPTMDLSIPHCTLTHVASLLSPHRWYTYVFTTTDGLHFAHFRQETACTILFGSVLDWNGSAWQGHGRWSVTPPKKKDTERGVLMLHLRSTVDGPAESTVMIVSDAAKSIHNMMCVLFDKQKWQVRTRAKWEIEEAAKAEKSGAS